MSTSCENHSSASSKTDAYECEEDKKEENNPTYPIDPSPVVVVIVAVVFIKGQITDIVGTIVVEVTAVVIAVILADVSHFIFWSELII